MGRDINLYAEVSLGSGWELADEMAYDEFWGKQVPKRIETNRDQVFFGVLSNVSYIKEEGFLCVSDNRGLPRDVCSELKAQFEREETSYSPSWILIDELMKFKWDQSYDSEKTYAEIRDYMEFYEDIQDYIERNKSEKIRLVLWYDS